MRTYEPMSLMARNAAIAAIVCAGTMPPTVLSGVAAAAARGEAVNLVARLRDQGLSALPASPVVHAQAPSAASGVTVDCGDAVTALTCAELVPTPDLRQVRARLTLTSPSSPFGVSVTADGRPLVRAAVDIDGLPDASTLGDGGSRVYVAWVTTLTMS